MRMRRNKKIANILHCFLTLTGCIQLCVGLLYKGNKLMRNLPLMNVANLGIIFHSDVGHGTVGLRELDDAIHAGGLCGIPPLIFVELQYVLK